MTPPPAGAIPALPIDAILSAALADLRSANRLILTAPPGAGKTTRLPPALLEAIDGRIVVTQPRRLAARMAAARVAAERGTKLGGEVGYRVRFDERVSAATRIEFATEGVLLRRLLSDPDLTGTGAVLLDEFHERSVEADLLLMLLTRLQTGPRPDLKLVVMSATLDVAAVGAYLGEPAHRHAEGRAYPVTVDYRPAAARRGAAPPTLERQVAAAVEDMLSEGSTAGGGHRPSPGDVLVFLPGAAEIRACERACTAAARRHGAELVPLHGSLSAKAQDRAVPSTGHPKVILSTNVAETSLTLPGVTAVIDSGLRRRARFVPWSGMTRLDTATVSQASATQRSGRAGRTGPGRCLRLYTETEFKAMPAHDAPAIATADLSGPLLTLAGAGAPPPEELDWLQAPDPERLARARALLADLGALDPGGTVTAEGRALLELPLHPRLARVARAAAAGGATTGEAALLAALLNERGPWARRDLASGEPAAPPGPADVLAAMDAYRAVADAGFRDGTARRYGLDPTAVAAVRRTAGRLAKALGEAAPAPDGRRAAKSGRMGGAGAGEAPLLAALVAGFPDRIAQRLQSGGRELKLAQGGSAMVAPTSVVRDGDLVVVVDAAERSGAGKGRVVAHSIARIEPEWLLDHAPGRLRDEGELVWDPAAERVWRVDRLCYDHLVLEESRRPPGPADAGDAAALLADHAEAAGLGAFLGEERWSRWRGRLGFLAELESAGEFSKHISMLHENTLPASDRRALRDACRGLSSFAELRSVGLWDLLQAQLPADRRRELDRLAPARIRLAGGQELPVHYPAGGEPWAGSYIQDFFGMMETPRIGGGRVSLVLHLWAPNGRAVQVTGDLAGFWANHYPQLRRELKRHYPKHHWPEDPSRPGPRLARHAKP